MRAEFVVRGSVSLGKKLKVSLFAIGIVIVAGGTSLPELASAVKAVVADHSDLAVGAVIIRSAKDKNLVPSAAVGQLLVAIFALFFIESSVIF